VLFICCVLRVQANQESLKLNDPYQLIVNAGDVNILGRSVDTIQKNTEV